MIKSFVKKTLRAIAGPAFQKELNSRQKLAELYQETLPIIAPQKNCSAIVFSKNRAIQLHALLSTYYHYINNPAPLYILYTTSSDRHEQSYKELIALYSHHPIHFVKETSFKKDLEKILDAISSTTLFFMTDDGIFLDHADLQDILSFTNYRHVPSLIKGKDLTYCYVQNKPQPLPDFTPETNSLLSWDWSRSPAYSDWAYPFSVDTSFFVKQEIEHMIRSIDYKGPNSLETALHQTYLPVFLLRKGICYEKAKYVNVVSNVVNSEHANRHSGFHTPDDLLAEWEKGNRILFEEFAGLPCGIAEVKKFSFTKR